MERKLDAFTAYTLLCTKRNSEKKLFLTKGFWTWCAKTLELLWCNFILLFSKEMKLTALGFRKHTSDNYSREYLYSNGVRYQDFGFWETLWVELYVEKHWKFNKYGKTLWENEKQILWLLGYWVCENLILRNLTPSLTTRSLKY